MPRENKHTKKKQGDTSKREGEFTIGLSEASILRNICENMLFT